MTLDWQVVSRLVTEMSKEIAAGLPDEADRVAQAVAALRDHSGEVARLNERVSSGKMVGSAAGLIEPLDRRVPLPETPTDYTIVGSDGSLVEPDRHGTAYYYLLNIGTVLLRYGKRPGAELRGDPSLGFRPEDLYLELGDREVPLEGGVLRVKRAVAETERLRDVLMGELASRAAAEGLIGETADSTEEMTARPIIGLQDGTLALWIPEGRGMEADLRKALLPPFLKALDALRAADLTVASYISRPRSTELVNALRAAVCPHPTVDCRHFCPRRSAREGAPCDSISGVTDRRVIGALPLADGERSALFFNRSPAMEQYRENRAYFCYVNVGSEIARLEMPEWVALDRVKCDLLHAVVYDQCRRGAGYPRVLTEAHEKAVISTADRQQCERLVERALARQRVHLLPSEKQQSKRLRGV